MFPRINQFKNDSQEELEINEYGVKSIVGDLYGDKRLSAISVEGLSQIRKALDLIEFDQLKHV